MSLAAHHITYIHPDNETLFRQIDLILPERQKAALIGNNGCGKSTHLKILAGEITPRKREYRRSMVRPARRRLAD